MLTHAELATLLTDLESDRVERTISISNTDKFCEAICAFANDAANGRQPGYLIVGAADDGSLSGLTVTDQLLQSLAGIRSDGNIQPLPAIVVEKFSFPAGDLAVVEVQPSDLPPVRYKGRVYIRVGPRRAIANEQEERLLSEKRVSFARSFDASPCMEAGKNDLALGVFGGVPRTSRCSGCDRVESPNDGGAVSLAASIQPGDSNANLRRHFIDR
jgi:ATP-dependent DNA helicase RecG